MRGAKGIKFAFATLRETAQTTQLAQAGHALALTSQDLVRVGLVTDIPHQPVMRGVEHRCV